MKKVLILIFLGISCVVSATNYYVKNGGNNSLSGKSDSLAWGTVNQVNKFIFSPGDTIFFKRGCSWNESFKPSSSGTKVSPIVFSAYGSGTKPIISGYIKYSGWKKWGTNIYYVTGIYQTAALCLFDGKYWGTKVDNTSDLDTQFEYREVIKAPVGGSDDTLFVYTNNSTDVNNVVFAKFASGVYINNKEYITIEKINVQYWGGHCVNVVNSSYINIDSCKIGWAGFQGINFDATTYSNISNNILHNNGNDGTYVAFYSDFINVFNNYLIDNGHNNSGADRQSMGYWFCHDVNVYNNTIIHNGYGAVIEASSLYGNFYQENFKIYNNRITASMATKGVFNIFAGDFDIYNNIVVITNSDNEAKFIQAGEFKSTHTKFRAYNNTVIGPKVGIQLATDGIISGNSHFTLKNNIFTNVSSRYFSTDLAFLDNLISDNNLYLNEGSKFWAGPNYDLSGWRTVTGEDMHSIIGDPLFINAAVGNYTLSKDSPAINKGTGVGILLDHDGTVRDNFPDMGAFEYNLKQPVEPGQPEVFNLYPNPNNGHFLIELPEPKLSQESEITIVNLDGKSVFKGTLLPEERVKEFDLSYLSPGIYTIILSDRYIIFTRRFIKI